MSEVERYKRYEVEKLLTQSVPKFQKVLKELEEAQKTVKDKQIQEEIIKYRIQND